METGSAAYSMLVHGYGVSANENNPVKVHILNCLCYRDKPPAMQQPDGGEDIGCLMLRKRLENCEPQAIPDYVERAIHRSHCEIPVEHIAGSETCVLCVHLRAEIRKAMVGFC